MIGTNLPPGTEIICINDTLGIYQKPGVKYFGHLDGLTKNQIYTIKQYCEMPLGAHKGEIRVELNEITRATKYTDDGDPISYQTNGFNRARFRRLHLPECLTSLLNTKELETTK